jgi:hypothetical protein
MGKIPHPSKLTVIQGDLYENAGSLSRVTDVTPYAVYTITDLEEHRVQREHKFSHPAMCFATFYRRNDVGDLVISAAGDHIQARFAVLEGRVSSGTNYIRKIPTRSPA